MKKILFILLMIPLVAIASDVYVVHVQPRYHTTFEKHCRQVQVEVQGSTGNQAGGVLGAIAGAAIGNQVGGGTGKDIATVVGGVIGYQVGRGEEQSASIQERTVCKSVPVTIQRGETVTFSYKGQRFTHTFD